MVKNILDKIKKVLLKFVDCFSDKDIEEEQAIEDIGPIFKNILNPCIKNTKRENL